MSRVRSPSPAPIFPESHLSVFNPPSSPPSDSMHHTYVHGPTTDCACSNNLERIRISNLTLVEVRAKKLTSERTSEMNRKFALLTAVIAIAVTSAVAGMNNPMVGGQEMYPTKNISQNAVNSADHTTLVAAVKAAGLVETLEGAGPFTVFAPTNSAFSRLPKGTVEGLLKPENKKALAGVLTYHVVAGDYSAKQLLAAIQKGKGKAQLKTVEGE